MSTEEAADLLEAWLELLLGRLVLGVTMSSAKSGLPEGERGCTLGDALGAQAPKPSQLAYRGTIWLHKSDCASTHTSGALQRRMQSSSPGLTLTAWTAAQSWRR